MAPSSQNKTNSKKIEEKTHTQASKRASTTTSNSHPPSARVHVLCCHHVAKLRSGQQRVGQTLSPPAVPRFQQQQATYEPKHNRSNTEPLNSLYAYFGWTTRACASHSNWCSKNGNYWPYGSNHHVKHVTNNGIKHGKQHGTTHKIEHGADCTYHTVSTRDTRHNTLQKNTGKTKQRDKTRSNPPAAFVGLPLFQKNRGGGYAKPQQ